MTDHILILNAGSSSVKFALFSNEEAITNIVSGMVDGIGEQLILDVDGSGNQNSNTHPSNSNTHPSTADHNGAVALVLDYLGQTFMELNITAVGHRIVHGGMNYSKPALLISAVIAKLEKLAPFAPLHQMQNLAGVKAAQHAFPDAVQYGCFDTSFHRQHPWVNDAYGLPREYYDEGVRRYGFHGLSYEYIHSELTNIAPDIANSRVVIAHLGNGASMCAMKDGKSYASTMGFSPLDGLPMGTRCGQIDPGALLYLMDQKGKNADEITNLLYYQSGLIGLSGISSDMRKLLASDTEEASQAVDYFVAHTRRELGAMAATIDGIDALVFTGGIGENARSIRARICERLDWLGAALDKTRNEANETIISTDTSQTKIMVIPTNEELTIARKASLFL